MARKTVYCVQTYGGTLRQLVRGPLRQFGNPGDARVKARELSQRARGVVVFKICGEPDFDAWEDPEVLEVHGHVPKEVRG